MLTAEGTRGETGETRRPFVLSPLSNGYTPLSEVRVAQGEAYAKGDWAERAAEIGGKQRCYPNYLYRQQNDTIYSLGLVTPSKLAHAADRA